jgi:hypothetical protein
VVKRPPPTIPIVIRPSLATPGVTRPQIANVTSSTTLAPSSSQIPQYSIFLPLTDSPAVSLIRSSSNNIVYDLNNGLTFTDRNSVGSSSYLALSIPTSVKRPMISSISSSMTVCFNLYLSSYQNTNALRIFTQGDKSVPLSQYNNESIKIYIGDDGKIGMDVTTDSQKSTTIVTNIVVSKETWYFIAYTIDADKNNTTVTLFVNTNNGLNIATKFNTQSVNSDPNALTIEGNNNNNYTTSVVFPRTIISDNKNPTILYNDFQIGDRFKQDGYGMNGNIRYFTVFSKALSNNQLKSFSSQLSLYIPLYTTHLLLTSRPDASFIRSASNGLVFDPIKGLTFTDHNSVGSSNYLTIPVNESVRTNMM